MRPFLIALQFLTRLPITFNAESSDRQLAQSVLYYPLVGAVIGCVLCFIAYVLSGVSSLLVAAMILTVWVLITGGLHLDGLADSADAWVGGYGDKQRSLEIMKDPAAGPLAVVVLILILLIKFSAIISLLENDYLWAFLLAPVMGRLSVIVLFLTTPYVRQQGLGASMAEFLNRNAAFGVIIITMLVALLLIPLKHFLLTTAVVMIMLYFLRYLMIKRLAGMTGDTIGASLEIVEASTLFILAVTIS